MFAALLSTASLPAPARAEGPKPTLKVAALLPLTGGAAEQGQWSREGLELAARDENGSVALELVFDDSRGDSKTAVELYQRLKADKGIAAVITWGSSVGMSLTPLVNRDRVIQMGVATGTPSYRSEGDFTFRNYHSSADEGAFIAREAYRRLETKKAAVLRINNDYGLTLGDGFVRAFESLGGSVELDQSFDPGLSDFRSLLTALKRKDAGFLVVASYPTEAALIIRQAQQLGHSLPIFAGGAVVGGSSFFDLLQGAGEGLLVAVPAAPDNAEARSFRGRYDALHGSVLGPYNWYAARSYDGLQLLRLAAGRCGSVDPDCLKKELFSVKDYQGASGVLSFDSAGDISAPLALLVLKGRAFEPAAPGGL